MMAVPDRMRKRLYWRNEAMLRKRMQMAAEVRQ